MTPPLPPSLRRAFVDTSAYFAFISPRDARHKQAISISRGLADQNWRLFTSNYLIAETHALLLNRIDRSVALSFLQEIDRSTTQIVRATAADERRAREIIEHYADKDFSLADAISFSIMERTAIRSVFTFDQHFSQYGFQVLTREVF